MRGYRTDPNASERSAVKNQMRSAHSDAFSETTWAATALRTRTASSPTSMPPAVPRAPSADGPTCLWEWTRPTELVKDLGLLRVRIQSPIANVPKQRSRMSTSMARMPAAPLNKLWFFPLHIARQARPPSTH